MPIRGQPFYLLRKVKELKEYINTRDRKTFLHSQQCKTYPSFNSNPSITCFSCLVELPKQVIFEQN